MRTKDIGSVCEAVRWCCSSSRTTNQRILQIATLCFSLFVIAELIGASLSRSLSLLGDASAMSVDVFAYITNMYAEHSKEKHGMLSERTVVLTSIVTPFCSVSLLLIVTLYVVIQATIVLARPHQSDNTAVNVSFLYGFAITNLVVDLVCFFAFYKEGSSIFVEESVSSGRKAFDREDDFDSWLDDGDDFLIATTGSGGVIPSKPSGLLSRLRHSMRLPPPSPDEPGDANSRGREGARNLNMLSAGAHVLGDTLRTIFMLAAALISSTTGIDGAVCDAWGAIAVSLVIVAVAASLVREIIERARGLVGGGTRYSSLNDEDDDEDDGDGDVEKKGEENKEEIIG